MKRAMRLIPVICIISLASPHAAIWAQERPGEAAYAKVCQVCHGPEGRGNQGPALTPMTIDPNQVLGIVREGFGQMPPISSRELSDEQVLQVVEYLRSPGSDAPADSGLPATRTPSGDPAPAPVKKTGLASLTDRIDRAAITGDLGTLTRLRDETLAWLSHTATVARYAAAYADWQYAVQSAGPESATRAPALADAVEHLQQVIAADNGFAEAHALLAAVYAMQLAGQPGSQSPDFRIFTELQQADPFARKNPRVALLLGIVSAVAPPPAGSGLDHAVSLLRLAIKLFEAEPVDAPWPNWGHAEAHAWLGQVLARRNDVKGARAAYERALVLKPDFIWVNGVLLPALPAAK
jgi:tetratricopeptide (TPR) repeat protein